MNTWTGLFVNLNGKGEQSETQMKKIGNVNIDTKAVTLYPEGHQYYETELLYFVNSSGEYELL